MSKIVRAPILKSFMVPSLMMLPMLSNKKAWLHCFEDQACPVFLHLFPLGKPLLLYFKVI